MYEVVKTIINDILMNSYMAPITTFFAVLALGLSFYSAINQTSSDDDE